MGPNRILTVSYGAFSCTLEGFDDPFSAMKDIAEYFRDLAAQDRLFGAEPPTPDAQMLHAIAQNSAIKPVRAAMTDDGIRLSQGSPTDTPEAPVDSGTAPDECSDDGAEPTADPSMPVFDAGLGSEIAEVESAPGTSDRLQPRMDETAALAIDDTLTTPEAPTPVFATDDPVLPEMIIDDALPDTVALGEAYKRAEIDLDEARFEPEMADLPAIKGKDTSDYEAEVSALFQVPSTDLPEPDARREQDQAYTNAGLSASSIAAKLQRIRSVVAASSSASFDTPMPDFDVEDTDDLTDAITFAAPAAETRTDDTETDSTAETEPLQEDAPLVLTEATEAAAVDDMTVAQDEPLGPEAAPALRLNEDGHTEAEISAASDEDVIAATLGILAQEDPSAVVAPAKDDTELSEEIEDATAVGGTDDAVEDAGWASTDLSLTGDEDDAAPSAPEAHGPKTAPLGLSHEDLEAAAALTRTRDAPRPEAFANSALLDPQDPEAPDVADADVNLIEDQPVDTASSDEISDSLRHQIISDPDQDGTVERLLAETDTQLKEQGAQRRQSALSHLKAAVAATLADRIGTMRRAPETPPSVPPEEADNSAEDIAHADAPAPSEAPIEDDGMVAPLVLVPQARIDQSSSDDAVRPRRITRSALSSQDDMRAQDTGFATYVGSVGATELRDLLEAAAAYLSSVEGKSYFSRPEVMHLVMRHDRDHSFSREDSLRGFGDLLRDGTIEKVSRGQFAISTASRFVANG